MRRSIPFVLLLSTLLIAACEDDRDIRGEEVALLAKAPDVPPPLERDHPAHVTVEIETTEEVQRLADGVEYTFWTFGGQVPGDFIRIREGDRVTFTLNNRPDSRMPHNIDLHAVTGPGGGAAASLTPPGTSTTFSFEALNPGLYVYHCATAPVGMHIANGMYGLILVEPEEGLPPVDREYYVMQSEFYTRGRYGDAGLQPFDMQKAMDENPDYVVFNGSVGSTVGERSLRASVGETVRLYVGNAGPNLISSFHVIGEIFDLVYAEGGTQATQENVQSTLVPAGGSAMVEFRVDVPGEYILVDHSIFRAFNKGALAMLSVDGPADSSIYSGLESQDVYMLEGGAVQEIERRSPEPPPERSKAERIAEGERIYTQNCAACHQPEGQGVGAAFPPLAGSDYLLEEPMRGVRAVVHGLSGPIEVKGTTYNGLMPAVRLSDDQVANVVTYILNAWGNDGGEITPVDVQRARENPPEQPLGAAH